MLNKFYLKYHLYIKILLTSVIIVSIIIGILIINELSMTYKKKITEQTMHLAKLGALKHREIIEETQRLLFFIDKNHPLLSYQPEDCNQLMRELLASFPRYTNFAVVGADGKIYCSALETPINLNTAYLPYIQQVLQNRQFTVGQYQMGTLTNKPVMPLAIPLYNADEEIEAVFVAFLDLSWLSELNVETTTPDMVYNIIDSNGVVLGRQPKVEDYLEKKMDDKQFIQMIKKEGEGSIIMSGLDGQTRIYSFTPIFNDDSNYQVYFIVGISVVSTIQKIIFSYGLGILLLVITVFFARVILIFGTKHLSYLVVRRELTNGKK